MTLVDEMVVEKYEGIRVSSFGNSVPYTFVVASAHCRVLPCLSTGLENTE